MKKVEEPTSQGAVHRGQDHDVSQKAEVPDAAMNTVGHERQCARGHGKGPGRPGGVIQVTGRWRNESRGDRGATDEYRRGDDHPDQGGPEAYDPGVRRASAICPEPKK